MTSKSGGAKDTEQPGHQPSDPEQLREEIQQTREDLGETVEALVQKTNVKDQVKEKMAERKEALRAAQEQAKQKVGAVGQQARERRAPLATAAAVLVVGLVVLWLIRRH
jgi:preprotein translocase subunit SecF